MRARPFGVEMGEPCAFIWPLSCRAGAAHASPPPRRLAASGFRRRGKPDAGARQARRSAGVEMPLSATDQAILRARAAPGASVVREIDCQGLEIAVVDADQAASPARARARAPPRHALRPARPCPASRAARQARRRGRRRPAAMITGCSRRPARALRAPDRGQHEILAQHRQVDRRARGAIRCSARPGRRASSVSTDRQAAPPRS